MTLAFRSTNHICWVEATGMYMRLNCTCLSHMASTFAIRNDLLRTLWLPRTTRWYVDNEETAESTKLLFDEYIDTFMDQFGGKRFPKYKQFQEIFQLALEFKSTLSYENLMRSRPSTGLPPDIRLESDVCSEPSTTLTLSQFEQSQRSYHPASVPSGPNAWLEERRCYPRSMIRRCSPSYTSRV